ncbi:MAG: hypothetical protein ACXW5U_19055 [Thermoanaerobaculia bacterium]
MAFIGAATGPPPQVELPDQEEVLCEEPQEAAPRAYLVLTVRQHHDVGTPALANTAVEITVGATPMQNVTTDGNGVVTFTYEAAADFANVDVLVTVAAAARRWPGRASTANAVADDDAHQLAVTVRGQFRLTALVRVLRPPANEVGWPFAWAANLALTKRSTPPNAAAATTATAFAQTGDATPLVTLQLDVDCMTAHELSIPFRGFIAANSLIRVNVDGAGLQAAPTLNAVTVANVTYQRTAATNLLALTVERHGAAVEVRFVFAFQQVLIVGEGDRLEYALGLAAKYGDVLNARGFQWVVATQYDVTNIGALTQDTDVLNWLNGHVRNHVDLRAEVQAAQTKNLIVRGVQFNARTAQHWTDVRNAYGRFDAVVFNNPHPGYGLPMCVVLGLTTNVQYARKNGKAISVLTFGYGATLTLLEKAQLLAAPGNQRGTYGRERWFVRTHLNYWNDVNTAVAEQFRVDDSTARNLTIDDAFSYADGNDTRINDQTFGLIADMGAGTRSHYESRVDTIGMQGHLLRCYRHFGRGVLKANSHLYINGSAAWAAALTAQFTMAGQVVPAMTNVSGWRIHGTYFVYYYTNFTSALHDPSWYSDPGFNPREPDLGGARCYRWSN